MDLWKIMQIKDKILFYNEIYEKIKKEIISTNEDNIFMYVRTSNALFKKKKIRLDDWISEEFNIRFFSDEMDQAKKMFSKETIKIINIVDCYLRKEVYPYYR